MFFIVSTYGVLLEKEMATHSSILAWRIPGTEEPGGLLAVYGVAQSRTRLKRLSSSSMLLLFTYLLGNANLNANVKHITPRWNH